MKIRRKRRYREIEPDEILIDAQNLPGFDALRLEGKIERPIESNAFRTFLIISLLIGLLFVGQLLKLQVVDSATLKNRAEANRLKEALIISERGRIVDRNGTPLALNNPDHVRGFATRNYPFGEAASHLLGYVSYPKRDNNGFWFQDSSEGLSGVESILNSRLRGENGAAIQEISATGEIVSGSTVQVPKNGEEIHLSVDALLQQKLYELIKTRAEESGFTGGSGVIMDVETGELYALASYPSFNPELVSSGEAPETIAEYVTNEKAPFLNRVTNGLYTPGSVVKPFVALGALEEGIISPDKVILSTGSITVPNQYDPSNPSVFRDWKEHGWVDMVDAIAVSSDVYFYAISGGLSKEVAPQAGVTQQEGLGISAIESYMREFQFGEPSGVPFGSEEIGTIPSPEWKAQVFGGERWFLGNTYHTAIGQYGFQVTGIQLVRAVAALANGGALITPTIEKNHRGERQQLGYKQENISIINRGMRQAVTDGTATALNLPGINVAAKTGTAEVGSQKQLINSLIVGFFPYENPRFAFTVVMERAKAGTLSGAPLVMRELFEWMQTERSEMLEIGQ